MDEDENNDGSNVTRSYSSNVEENVSGGGYTERTYTRPEYKDTAQTKELNSQLERLRAERAAYRNEIKDMGVAGKEIMQDPNIQAFKAQEAALRDQIKNSKEVVNPGGFSETVYDRDGFEVSSKFTPNRAPSTVTNPTPQYTSTPSNDPAIEFERDEAYEKQNEATTNRAILDSSNYAAEQRAAVEQRLADRQAIADGVEGEYDFYANPEDDPNQWFNDDTGQYEPRTDRPEDWESRDVNEFAYNDDTGEWVRRDEMPDNWNYGGEPVTEEPQYDDFGCIIGVEEYDDTDGICVPIGGTSNYLAEPPAVDERDENGCLIGSEYYDDETMECVPIGTTPEIYDPETVAAEQAYQRSVKDARKPINKGDWRFRVSLSPFSNYLYNDPYALNGVLRPLKETDGVIFPYVPRIDQTYYANYEDYNLTHSNYRGYFYQGSHNGDIIVNSVFTAQDTAEANYLLAAIHFFRSATKMFYGQDVERGSPPPLLYLNGLGEYQFNEHPCIISIFNYNLPDDVDYIKCSKPGSVGVTNSTQFIGRNDTGGYQSWSSKLTRLISSGLSAGAPPVIDNLSTDLQGVTQIVGGETYVPTRINIALTFKPVQTRKQVSSEFSLKNYATGDLLKKGFW